MKESPSIVHGRLLEAVTISGYTMERACDEFEWLLENDRWKEVGGGYDNIHDFLDSIQLSDFKLTVERREAIAKKLDELKSSQRKSAEALGVSKTTILRDLEDESGTNVPDKEEKDDLEQPKGGENGRSGTNVPDKENDDPLFVEDPEEVQKELKTKRNKKRKRKKKKEKRKKKIEEKATALKDIPLPERTYSIILTDPPWQYDFAETDNRKIENHYPTMTMEELYNLEVPANDNCLLFLWTTAPKIPEAIQLIEEWEFDYKTCAVWDKKKIGMGYWFRGQHELLFVVTKGNISPPDPENRVSSVISEKRTKHSVKPEKVYQIIENQFPKHSKVELFARKKRKGWDHWGNELLKNKL